MDMILALLLLLFTPSGISRWNVGAGLSGAALTPFHWVKVKDSNAVHQRYLTSYGNVIGEYYLPHKPTYPAKYGDYPYVAQCFDGRPEAFAEEKQAKRFIEACKGSPDF